MAQFPWFSWVALKIEIAKCFVLSMWQQNQTNFFPLYVSVQMIKLQGVCSRNFERRRGQDEHRLKIMNYMYCMFIKRTIPGGVNKKIVINNHITYTYVYIYIQDVVYTDWDASDCLFRNICHETLNCPRNPVFNCNSTNFCSPLIFIKVIIFSACGKDYWK